MSDAPTSLRHAETPKAEDTALAQEARSHVANNRSLQLIAELILKLRGSRVSWWTPELLRDAWNANERMGWFNQRPDIRQRITCSLTGLRPKAARNKKPDFQAALIDSVIDDGDVTVDQFESAFDPIEIAAYAPAGEIWHRFRERMPWDQDGPQNQEFVVWLIERLLASSSTLDGMTRKPILTAHAIRTAIPGKLWHSRIPLDIRVAIDELRLERERTKPGEPFHAVDELSVATPAIIAANIPMRELLCVIDIAEKAMGLPSSREWPLTAPSPKVEEVAKAEPPKADAKVQPAVQPTEKVPEKPAETPVGRPAEKPAQRPLERWERLPDRVVLEKVGKEDTAEER